MKIILFLLIAYLTLGNCCIPKPFDAGVILDMESHLGRMCSSSISTEVDDFYSVPDHYATRLVLHDRDSRDPSSAVITEFGFRNPTTIGLAKQLNKTLESYLSPMIWLGEAATVPKGWRIPIKNAIPERGVYGDFCSGETSLTDFHWNDDMMVTTVGDTEITGNRSLHIKDPNADTYEDHYLNCASHGRLFIIISVVSLLSFVLHPLLCIFRNPIHNFCRRLKGIFHIELGELSEARILDSRNIMVSIDPDVFVKDSKQ